MLLAVANLGAAFRFFVFLHILAVVAAFGPGFVAPFQARQRRESGVMVRALSAQIHGGALALAGLFGIFAVITARNDVYKMSQSWVSIGLFLWLVMLAVLFVGLLPAERKLAAGGLDDVAKATVEQRMAMLFGAMHLLFLLQVIDMIWQPGL
jgi:hypothetical protein